MHFTALSCCSALHHSVIDSIICICIYLNTSVDIYSCAECECSCCECNEWQMSNTTAQANASSLSYTDTDTDTHTHTRPLELLHICHDARTYHATTSLQHIKHSTYVHMGSTNHQCRSVSTWARETAHCSSTQQHSAQLKSALQRTITQLRWCWVLAVAFCCCSVFYALQFTHAASTATYC